MCGILLITDAVSIEADGQVHRGKIGGSSGPSAVDFHDTLRSRGPDKLGTSTVSTPIQGFCTRGGTLHRGLLRVAVRRPHPPLLPPPLQVHAGAATLQFLTSLLQLRGDHAASTPLTDAVTGNVLAWNGEIFGGLEVAPGANDAALLLAHLRLASSSDHASVVSTFSQLRGPWAAAFWHAASSTLFYGRDVLGRRSLLVHLPRADDGRLMLTSVAPADPSVPFDGFSEVPPGLYSVDFRGGQAQWTAHDWVDPLVRMLAAFERPAQLIEPDDCTSQQPLQENGSEPLVTAVDADLHAATDVLLGALREAVAVQCACIEAHTALKPGDSGASPGQGSEAGVPPARVLVLFSGGVDSTLIAALVHEALPPGEPVDLACICFAGGTSPDRVAALDALHELQTIAPDRPWRLIAVNKTLGDLEASKSRLLRLLSPKDTVMDYNISGALWLATHADGVLVVGPPQLPAPDAKSGHPEAECRSGGDAGPVAPAGKRYCSAARVAFLGHGADELFAGYGRHRTRFRNAGWQGLSDELALDVRRLWSRNLGRDDRMVADRGREARHPFLDEAVMAAALACPLPVLADLRLPPGVGDKRVLRQCLRRLGLPRAAARVKRAIQFGSRLAKATNAAHFGGTRQANTRNAGSVRLADVGLAEHVGLS